MFLYTLAIEELIIRIKENSKIKGYSIVSTIIMQIKVSGYADDIVGYVVDDQSVKEFFIEFDKWGEISGALLNKKKTQILNIHDQNEKQKKIKILGVEFNNKGCDPSNKEELFKKLEKTTNIWNTVKLNLLERVVVAKTFLLSQFYFLTNFITYSDKEILNMEKLIFGFLWNNKLELIKRDTLILSYDQGGLNMFNIRARIETILQQQFIYI